MKFRSLEEKVDRSVSNNVPMGVNLGLNYPNSNLNSAKDNTLECTPVFNYGTSSDSSASATIQGPKPSVRNLGCNFVCQRSAKYKCGEWGCNKVMCPQHALLVEDELDGNVFKCDEHADSWIRRGIHRVKGTSPKSNRARSVGFEDFRTEKKDTGVGVTPSLAGGRSKSASGDNNGNSSSNTKTKPNGIFKQGPTSSLRTPQSHKSEESDGGKRPGFKIPAGFHPELKGKGSSNTGSWVKGVPVNADANDFSSG